MMENFKMLGLAAALAAAALVACVSTAFADEFTSPSGTTYTSTIAAAGGPIELHGPFITVKCNKSALEAKVEKHGFSWGDTGGKISTLTLVECNFPVKVLKAGSFDVDAQGGGLGDFQLFGTEVTAETSIANCLWTASSSGSTLGAFTGNNAGKAKIDFSTGEIPRTGHSIFCGSVGYLVGSYTVNTPSVLTVDGI